MRLLLSCSDVRKFLSLTLAVLAETIEPYAAEYGMEYGQDR
jgi:hypothetical protein